MKIPDAGVLVQAFRADAPEHSLCREWLQSVVDGDARFGVAPRVLADVVRTATDPRVFLRPNKPARVVEFCEALLEQPHCVRVEPGPKHWSVFARLCETTEARGALTGLAWNAALAIEWGCEWITLDRDYARFAGLRWQLPA